MDMLSTNCVQGVEQIIDMAVTGNVMMLRWRHFNDIIWCSLDLNGMNVKITNLRFQRANALIYVLISGNLCNMGRVIS